MEANKYANFTHSDFEQALNDVCKSYHLVIPDNDESTGRATGRLSWSLFIFKDSSGKRFLRARAIESSQNSLGITHWHRSHWGYFCGEGTLTAPSFPGTESALFLGENRHYRIQKSFLDDHKTFSSGDTRMTEFVAPQTFEKQTGTVSYTSSEYWKVAGNVVGGIDGGKPKLTAALSPEGGESSSKTLTMPVYNYKIFDQPFGSSQIWEAVRDKGFDNKEQVKMRSEFIIQSNPGAGPETLTFFFASWFFVENDHNAFAAGSVPIVINWDDLTITTKSGDQAGNLRLEPGLPFEPDSPFGGDFLRAYATSVADDSVDDEAA